MEIAVKFRLGHTINETWVKTKFYCLACGQQTVWCRRDGGDYYQGENYLCSACSVDWNLPNEPSVDDDPENKQRLEKLRAADAG